MEVTVVVLIMMMMMMVVMMQVQHSMELKLINHLDLHNHDEKEVVELRINKKAEAGSCTKYIGLVMAYPPEEAALHNSGFFVPSSNIPFVDLAGRRFNIGKIKGVDVIYVMTGKQTLNAGITVQILVDSFDIGGIVHYGTAGSANDSLSLGDVSVPSQLAFTNSWKWKEFMSEKGQFPELNFGDFNLPNKGENMLGKVEFTPKELFSSGKQMEELFWLPIEPEWLDVATQLQDLKLQECVNDTYCLPETPKVVNGLRGSTADIFLDNVAFREFLFKEFNVSTVDEESAAVVMTCLSNGVPCIVFRGVSDWAGGARKLAPAATTLPSLAATNALNVAVEFIGLLNKQVTTINDH